MKKRIYKINNKNLVTGNPNEVTENEILVKENNDGTVELSHRNNGTLETLGSGGSGGSSNIKYYDVSSHVFSSSSTDIVILMLSVLGKGKIDDNIQISPNFLLNFYEDLANVLAIGIDTTMKIINATTQQIQTAEEQLKSIDKYDLLVSFPELTEEQFYDITLPTE